MLDWEETLDRLAKAIRVRWCERVLKRVNHDELRRAFEFEVAEETGRA